MSRAQKSFLSDTNFTNVHVSSKITEARLWAKMINFFSLKSTYNTNYKTYNRHFVYTRADDVVITATNKRKGLDRLVEGKRTWEKED